MDSAGFSYQGHALSVSWDEAGLSVEGHRSHRLHSVTLAPEKNACKQIIFQRPIVQY